MLESKIKALRECPKVEFMQNIFTGKPGERKLSRVCLVSFATSAERDKALKCMQAAKLEETPGRQLACKPALTFSSRERNNALRRAFRLAEDFSKKSGVDDPIDIDWKSRELVTPSGTIFRQSREGLGGSFLGPFSSLRLR